MKLEIVLTVSAIYMAALGVGFMGATACEANAVSHMRFQQTRNAPPLGQ